MNYIRARVSNIQNSGALHLVDFIAESQTIQMMSLELNKKVQIDSELILAVKSTNIALSRDISSTLSISNQLQVKIKDISHGELLSSVKFEFVGSLMESIITKESALKMDIKIDETFIALIGANEISISELL